MSVQGRRALIEAHDGRDAMTEPESHTLAYLRRIDEKLARLGSELRTEVGELRIEISGRLGRIEDELLVLNGIALRLEGREVETTGLKAILDRHERWLGELGRRIDELEGAPKG
jgi:hypothetical protein